MIKPFKITREELQEHYREYFKNGGTITHIEKYEEIKPIPRKYLGRYYQDDYDPRTIIKNGTDYEVGR